MNNPIKIIKVIACEKSSKTNYYGAAVWEDENCRHSLGLTCSIWHRKTHSLPGLFWGGGSSLSTEIQTLLLLFSTVSFFLVAAICEQPSNASHSTLFLVVKHLTFFFLTQSHESSESETLSTDGTCRPPVKWPIGCKTLLASYAK